MCKGVSLVLCYILVSEVTFDIPLDLWRGRFGVSRWPSTKFGARAQKRFKWLRRACLARASRNAFSPLLRNSASPSSLNTAHTHSLCPNRQRLSVAKTKRPPCLRQSSVARTAARRTALLVALRDLHKHPLRAPRSPTMAGRMLPPMNNCAQKRPMQTCKMQLPVEMRGPRRTSLRVKHLPRRVPCFSDPARTEARVRANLDGKVLLRLVPAHL